MEVDQQDPYPKRYQKGSEQQEKIVMAAVDQKISWSWLPFCCSEIHQKLKRFGLVMIAAAAAALLLAADLCRLGGGVDRHFLEADEVASGSSLVVCRMYQQ
jgi:hypothetical protein